MTPQEAHTLLDALRDGRLKLPLRRINQALEATGDFSGYKALPKRLERLLEASSDWPYYAVAKDKG